MCSMDTLIKRFRYIGIFYCFSTFGTILNIILFLSANSVAPKYLKNCYTYSFYTSHTGRPLPNLVQVIFFESIWIVSHDLECIMGFQFFLNISKTYYPIFNFNTSIRRSLLVLYFIFFDLRPLANL